MSNQVYIELFSALLAEDAAAVEKRVCAANFEFDQFCAFTNLHQLSGYLYLHIKAGPLEAVLPPDFLVQLGDRYAMQRLRCDDILQEAARIYDAFEAAHKSVLFLKGPFVAQQFYGGVYQRSYMDVDILIHREDLPAADQLLRDMGFSRLSMVLFNHNAMTRFTHTYDYHKRVTGAGLTVQRQYLPLDLHWRLRSHFTLRLDYATIWEQQEECRLQGRTFPVLSAEYALVMNVLGVFFDIELGVIRLKGLLDLYKMLETLDPVMDWNVFLEKRASENISGIVLNVFDLLLDTLDCRSRFPGVASVVEKNRGCIRLTDAADKFRLLERSRSSLHNRRWAHDLYQAPVLRSFLWTMISLPFRVAAHDRKFLRLLGRM
jgi:Uncharacterised nucleotidyltransferase